MKYNRNPLTQAISTTLCAGAAASMALASGVVFAQDDSDDNDEGVELDRVQVTGSRIKRVDVEGSTPVTTIKREDIDLAGDSTVAELLRASTFNSFGSFRDQSGFGNGFSGVSLINLRGLGSNRTLVLINGRRMSTFPGGGADSADINLIPLDMVERVEILRDGASAIYGSDAIAGVVNIITRKDMNGMVATVQAEDSTYKGGEAERYSVAGGISSDSGNVTFALEHFERDMIFDRDIPENANAVADITAGGGLTSFGFPGSAQLLSGPLAGLNIPDPRCPANVGDSSQFPNSYTWDFAGFAPGSDWKFSARCGYNFGADTIDLPRAERNSAFIDGHFDVTNNTQFLVRGLFVANEGESRFAGAPVTAPYPIYGADNPNNPLWLYIGKTVTDPGLGTHTFTTADLGDALVLMRTVPNGNREGWQYFDDQSLFAGFQGTNDWFGGTDWDFGFEYARNRTLALTKNLANKNEIQNAIDDGTLDYFNVQGLPFEQWRDNTVGTLTAFNHTGMFQADTDVITIDGSLSFDMFQMNNGPVPLVVGFEYFSSSFTQENDPESNRLIIAGTSGGDNIYGVGRKITTFYAESVVPLFSTLELDLAVRYDDYDDFGGTTNPKVSVAWRPWDSWLFRASYGEGFRAPNMQELYGNQSESFPPAVDIVGCANGVSPCVTTQYRAFFGGNPDLQPEESKSWTAGFVWNATDDLSFEVTYYNIEFTNQISTLSLSRMFQLESMGLSNTVHRNADGTVNFVQLTNLNLSGVKTDGMDFSANYSLATESAGLFGFRLDVSKILKYDSEAVQGDGFSTVLDSHGTPDLRGSWQVSWTMGDFQVGYTGQYIGENGDADGYCGNTSDGQYAGQAPCGSGQFLVHNDAQIYHDLQVAWNAPWDAQIAIGARNITDETGPFNGIAYGWPAIDKSQYSTEGRITYLRYKQNF